MCNEVEQAKIAFFFNDHNSVNNWSFLKNFFVFLVFH